MNTSYTRTLNQTAANCYSEQFEIRTLQWMQVNGNKSFSEATNEFVEIIWIKNGSGTIMIDEGKFIVTNNMLIFLTPGCQRKLTIDSVSNGFYISFPVDFLDIPVHQQGFSILLEPCMAKAFATVLYYNNQMHKEAEEIILKINNEFSNYFSFRQSLIKGLLQILILYLSREFKQIPPQSSNYKEAGISRKFMMLLKQNYSSMKLVSAYARELCITPNYLNRIVKQISGYTASHHIQQFVIQQAKRQASYSGASMKEIAYNLGFDNPAHFSKYFKNKSGLNFTSFKKQQAG